MKHKRLIISLTAVFTVIAALFVFLMVWFFGDKYEDFEDFQKEFAIPGLKEGALPQGMGNCTGSYEIENSDGTTTKKTQEYFFISAYMKDGSASRIYVTGSDTGYVGYVTMKNVDGSEYKGHCGGIATNGTTLWVTGESTVYVAKASSGYDTIAQEIINRASGVKVTVDKDGEKVETVPEKQITFTKTFNANCGADFCYYYDAPNSSADRLYIGEFYRKGNYETDKNHRVTTPEGYDNTAFAYEYNTDTSTSNPYGLTRISDSSLSDENKVPRIYKIVSLPEKIQGFARVGNTLALSQSYGLANSHILLFNWNKIFTTDNSKTYKELTNVNFEYAGVKRDTGVQYTVTDLRVYYADLNNDEIFLRDYEIPSMSEGLCTNGNKVYVLNESAGKKYKLFVRERIKDVYSLRIRNK